MCFSCVHMQVCTPAGRAEPPALLCGQGLISAPSGSWGHPTQTLLTALQLLWDSTQTGQTAMGIEKVIKDQTPWIIGCASAEGVQYRKWAWPSICSVDPSHCMPEVWFFSHVLFWSFSLFKLKFKNCYVYKTLYVIRHRSLLLLWSNS